MRSISTAAVPLPAPPSARGTTDLQIRNRPSDGVERTVSSALLLVSTAESDGV